jgi:hypothetical protein
MRAGPLKLRRLHVSTPAQPTTAATAQRGQPGNQANLRRLRAGPGAAPASVSLRGAPLAPDSAEAEDLAPQPATPADAPATGVADCPVTAVFSSTLAGAEKANCQVPDGAYGASRLTRWRLTGDPPASATITEQFKAIDDPYSMIGAIQQGTYTAANGLFDDCYMLAAKKPLPADFVLKVEQNHLLGGKIVSKNEITYYPDRIHFCSHRRLAQSCDFAARCSL